MVVELRTGSWFGSRSLALDFPDEWEVQVIEPETGPDLSDEEVGGRIAGPVESPPLAELARGRARATIVVDDLTRPTPVPRLLPFILRELERGGLSRQAVTVVVATGAHGRPPDDELVRKVGPELRAELDVVGHDCRRNLVELGHSEAGTPILVNRQVRESDLTVTVGGLYPHGNAGFSGGAKTLVPGVCGFETVRALHSRFRHGSRGGSIDTEFRREIDSIARRIGLDFVVNVAVNHEGRMRALWVGDPVAAHREGVTSIRSSAPRWTAPKADIVVADAYPFDTELQFADRRGFWPLWMDEDRPTPVAVAACSRGLGRHQLLPITMPLWKRALQMARRFRPSKINKVSTGVRSLARVSSRKQLPVLFLSSDLGERDLSRVFPRARLFREWGPLRNELRSRHPDGPVKVVVYRCASLLLPP